MSWLRALFLLAVLACFAACDNSSKSDPKTPGAAQAPAPTHAAVAGTIILPDAVEKFGVQIFAEGSGYSSFTDGQGQFVLRGLPPGIYVLRAQRGDLKSALVAEVNVAASDLAKTQPFLTIPPVTMELRQGAAALASATPAPAYATLRGRTVSEGGAPVEGVVLSQGDLRTITGPDGTFVFYNLPPQRHTFDVRHPQFQPTKLTVDLTAGANATVPDIRLAAEGRFSTNRTVFGRVRLARADGEEALDYSSVRVFLEGTEYGAAPDSDGNFQLRNIPPGAYVVSATAPGFVIEETVSANLLEIENVEVALTLLESEDTMNQYASLTGFVSVEDGKEVRTIAGVAVSLAGTSFVAFTDRDGVYTFDNVPTGTYDLLATLNGYETASLENIPLTDPIEYEASEITLKRIVDRPTVVFTNPEDGSRDLAIDQPTIVTIQFSKSMNTQSVREAISIDPPVDFQLRSGGGRGGREGLSIVTLELAAQSPSGKILRFRKRHTITIAGTAADIEGNTMEEDYAFSFTTAGARIIATIPEDGSAGFMPGNNNPIRIEFNAPIDPNTFRAEDVRISPATNAIPILRFHNNPRTGWTTAYIDVIGDFDTKYTVRLSRGARTITKDSIENMPYSFSFRTPKAIDGAEFLERIGPDGKDRRREERNRR